MSRPAVALRGGGSRHVRRLAPTAGTAAAATLVALVLGACGAEPTPGRLSIVVVNHEIVANAPARLLLAVTAADGQAIDARRLTLELHAPDSAAQPPSGPLQATRYTLEGEPSGGGPDMDDSGIFVAQPPSFAAPGTWRVSANVEGTDADPLTAEFEVLDQPRAPAVGERAPASDFPALGDPGVAAGALDARASDSAAIPDPALHSVALDESLATHRPALVILAGTANCPNRLCLPMLSLVESLADEYPGRADFIHVETFPGGGTAPAAGVTDWLPSDPDGVAQPWIFAIGEEGDIQGSWEAFAPRAELEAWLGELP